MAGKVKVQAVFPEGKFGFFDGRRIYNGEVFYISDEKAEVSKNGKKVTTFKQYSPHWMKLLDDKHADVVKAADATISAVEAKHREKYIAEAAKARETASKAASGL